jgi:hypothetical protein
MNTTEADNIKVMVRIRPLNERERKLGATSCVLEENENP